MTNASKHPRIAEEKAWESRRDRKSKKQKNSVVRDAFLENSTGFVDRQALSASLNAFMAQAAGTSELGQPNPALMAAPAPMAFAANNTNRWVPIGPSVVRQGQADGRPRVSGRVRDLAVSPDGVRAYAGTAKGGVWYTGDGGATWEPLGGWANEPKRIGGHISAFATGCMLVSFGANSATDFVMVGTGETGAFQGSAGAAPTFGMGILAAQGPARSLRGRNVVMT